MEQDFKKPPFTKAILTAVFVGLFTTILCLVFNIAFVKSTAFPLHSIINNSTLIFGVNIVFLVVGFVYYSFIQLKKGDLLFIIFFALLTAFLIWRSEDANRAYDHKVNTEFRELLSGTVLIIGIAATFLVPFLFHNKKFEDLVI